MSKLAPYIKFNDNACREAMQFYQSILGGKVEFSTIGDSPMSKEMPADKQDLIMYSTLTANKIMFFGSDMMRDRAVIGDNVGLALECESENELRGIFDKLKQGGDVFMDQSEQFWGGVFGVVTDKYGVEWMLNFQKKPIKK
ncbi:MAG: VOC family protein [Patescibacteria group bacterium]|nr:VOC family protein [Patescibacteria group bacterium]